MSTQLVAQSRCRNLRRRPHRPRAVLASLSLSVVVAAMILPAGPSGALGAAPVVPAALPSGPTDASTVPHYFGPWPHASVGSSDRWARTRPPMDALGLLFS